MSNKKKIDTRKSAQKIKAPAPQPEETALSRLKSFDENASKIPFSRRDLLLMLIITLVYAVISFINLGSDVFPETSWNAGEKAEYVIELSEDSAIGKVVYMQGRETGEVEASDEGEAASGKSMSEFMDDVMDEEKDENANFILSTSEDGKEYSRLTTIEGEGIKVFKWTTEEIETAQTARFVKIQVVNPGTTLFEMQLQDKDGKVIRIKDCDGEISALFDEQDKVELDDGFLHGTYFDEIFDVRAAYEFIHGLPVNDLSHPPLAKVITAAGIKIFGFNPFGWRVLGNLFGIAMVPLMYLLALLLFRKTSLAVLSSSLMALDFCHFVQTRISTLEMYIVTFIICMFLFMLIYMKTNYNRQPLWKTFIPLGLCGIFFGLGMATKWSAIFAGLGLAILFFITMFRRWREYKAALEVSEAVRGKMLEEVIADYKKKTALTLAFCVLFFIIVPIIILTLSYIPYLPSNEGQNLIQIMWENVKYMTTFHSDYSTYYDYQSKWWQWPLDASVLKMYSCTIEDTVSYIISFGNPIIWWNGSIAVFTLAVLLILRKTRLDDAKLFIVTGYGAQFIPWIFVSRFTIIYYYLVCVPFIILALAWCGQVVIKDKTSVKAVRNYRIHIAVFLLIALGAFILYYPILSGMTVTKEYVQNLRLFPGWQFFF